METTWFEDYVLNKNKIEIFIKYVVKLPVMVDNFNIDAEICHARQDGSRITVTFKKSIPEKLFEDIKKFSVYLENEQDVPEKLCLRNPHQYIVGYIKGTLPWLNKEIMKRKYNEGHIILKTVSLFDIKAAFLLDSEKKYYQVLWPLTIPKFPPIEPPNKNGAVYIRDWAGAMTDFFYFDFEECTRKIITSLENYFCYYNLTRKKEVSYPDEINKSGFKQLSFCYIQTEYYNYQEEDLEVLRNNIFFIYDIRCKIVHDNLRLALDDPNNLIFCRRAIKTLAKIYQSSFVKEDNKFNYIFSFYIHFESLLDWMTGLNLEQLEKASSNVLARKDIKNGIQGLKIEKKINGICFT